MAKIAFSAFYSLTRLTVFTFCGLLVAATAPLTAAQALAQSTPAAHTLHEPGPPKPTEAELAELKNQADAEPSDAKLRYNYGEALKRAGRGREAAHEYLAATELDPTFYHAYHQLSVCTNDKALIQDGIGRLNHLKDERPKDLMLRVALSELYEKRADYYLASRVLVDIIYLNAVPPKYLDKINNRIRFLQSKTKDLQALDKSPAGEAPEEAGPAPLPEASLSRDLSISKVKEPRVMQGFGHATLLP